MELYNENRESYLRLQNLFETHNLVGLDQLTGTGKTCIAIKWVEDNLNSNFLVISPNAPCCYSYHKNLDGKNVYYLTYSLLSRWSYDKLVDYVESHNITKFIIDEFHHSGAKEWQKGIERLLLYICENNLHCFAITSTRIRHLDNFRDMFNELGFEVIKGMSLEKFLMGNYSGGISYNVVNYPTNTDSLQTKILRKNISPTQQTELLNSLTTGVRKHFQLDLPTYFSKFLNSDDIKNRPVQKYLSFYSSKSALENNTFVEDILKKHGNVTVYTITASNGYAETLEILKKFESATEGIHILKCIDKLNEGLHPKGLTGIFFFRKTISYNVFLQQLGRAMEYGNMSKVYIFDMVSNIDELLSYKDYGMMFNNDLPFRVITNNSIDMIDDFKGLTINIAEMSIDSLLSTISKTLYSNSLTEPEKARIDFLYANQGLTDINIWIDSIPKSKDLIKNYLREKYNYNYREVQKAKKEKELDYYDNLLITHCPYEGSSFIKDFCYRKKLSKTVFLSLINRSKELGVNRDLSFNPTDLSLLRHLLFIEKIDILDMYKHFPNIHPAVVLKKCQDLNGGNGKVQQILNTRKQYWRKKDVNPLFNLSNKS